MINEELLKELPKMWAESYRLEDKYRGQDIIALWKERGKSEETLRREYSVQMKWRELREADMRRIRGEEGLSKERLRILHLMKGIKPLFKEEAFEEWALSCYAADCAAYGETGSDRERVDRVL